NRQQLEKAHERYFERPQGETQDVTTELENETLAAGQTFDAQTDHGKTGTPSTTIDVGTKCDDRNLSTDAGGVPDPKGEQPVQMKLEVSEPGDPDEDEADRIADQVMRMEEPSVVSVGVKRVARAVQRCAACEAEEEKWNASLESSRGGVRVRRKCAECEAK